MCVIKEWGESTPLWSHMAILTLVPVVAWGQIVYYIILDGNTYHTCYLISGNIKILYLIFYVRSNCECNNLTFRRVMTFVRSDIVPCDLTN